MSEEEGGEVKRTYRYRETLKEPRVRTVVDDDGEPLIERTETGIQVTNGLYSPTGYWIEIRNLLPNRAKGCVVNFTDQKAVHVRAEDVDDLVKSLREAADRIQRAKQEAEQRREKRRRNSDV